MNVESRVYLVINGNQYQTELLTWDNFCSFGLELTSRPGDPGAPHQHRTAHDAVVVADGLCQPHRAPGGRAHRHCGRRGLFDGHVTGPVSLDLADVIAQMGGAESSASRGGAAAATKGAVNGAASCAACMC